MVRNCHDRQSLELTKGRGVCDALDELMQKSQMGLLRFLHTTIQNIRNSALGVENPTENSVELAEGICSISPDVTVVHKVFEVRLLDTLPELLRVGIALLNNSASAPTV